MPASAETQAATIERFINGWSGWTCDGFLASWTGDCTTTTLPFSTKVPIRSREETERVFTVLMSFLTNFKLTVHNVVHDVARGKAAIYAITQAETPYGPYSNEHALFLWLDESGEKVQKVEETMDTEAMKDFYPNFARYMAEQESKAKS